PPSRPRWGRSIRTSAGGSGSARPTTSAVACTSPATRRTRTRCTRSVRTTARPSCAERRSAADLQDELRGLREGIDLDGVAAGRRRVCTLDELAPTRRLSRARDGGVDRKPEDGTRVGCGAKAKFARSVYPAAADEDRTQLARVGDPERP